MTKLDFPLPQGAGELLTPALLFDRDKIEKNLQRTIALAGSADNIWLHIKTHKTAEMIKMAQALGIEQFKAATLTEAELLASCRAKKVVFAYPLVGPAVESYVRLAKKYPETQFFAIGDDLGQIARLIDVSQKAGVWIPWLVDVNTGLNRTGVPIEELADFVKRAVEAADSHTAENVAVHGDSQTVETGASGEVVSHAAAAPRAAHLPVGLHCYDGHLGIPDFDARMEAVTAYVKEIEAQIRLLEADNAVQEAYAAQRLLPGDKVCQSEVQEAEKLLPLRIMGGTPTMPCHIRLQDGAVSPGTTVLWDSGYGKRYADLTFETAAAVLTRVISRPAPGIFTLDLGYKGIASDPPESRGVLVGMSHAKALFQNEEHWTFQMEEGHEAACPSVGQEFCVIPTHICPTCALYDKAYIIERENNSMVDRVTGGTTCAGKSEVAAHATSEQPAEAAGRIARTWKIAARNRYAED